MVTVTIVLRFFSAVLLTTVLSIIVAMAIVGNSAQHYCQIVLSTIVILAKVYHKCHCKNSALALFLSLQP